MASLSETDLGSVRIRFTLNTKKTRHMRAYEYLMSNSNRRGNMLADAVLLYAAITELYPNKKDYDRFLAALETYRDYMRSGRQSFASAISANQAFPEVDTGLITKHVPKSPDVSHSAPVAVNELVHDEQPVNKVGIEFGVERGPSISVVDGPSEDSPSASRRFKVREVSSPAETIEDDPLFNGLMAQMRRNGMDYDPRTARLLQEDLQDFEDSDEF